MRYGLDPRFRFTVSRAIYKGMLQFLCSQYNMDYVVQPLPVDHMALRMTSENEVELTWQPVADALEPTAVAEKYIVYIRIGDGDFDNGVLVDGNSYRTTLPRRHGMQLQGNRCQQGRREFPFRNSFRRTGVQFQRYRIGDKRIRPHQCPCRLYGPRPPPDTLLAGFLDEQDHGSPISMTSATLAR